MAGIRVLMDAVSLALMASGKSGGAALRLRVAVLRAGAAFLLAAPLSAQEPQTPRFGETLIVERIVVDVRVVDAAGRPILGLRPQDFRVKVGGQQVAVESALWVGAGQPEPEDPNAEVIVEPEPPVEPRLVVFLIQKDLERSRITGLLRMVEKAERLLAALRPDDRAAALLFDSQLRPLQDFSADKERVRRALREGLLHARPVQESGEPSLLAHLDASAARRAASPERALLLIGEALQKLPGAKTLVFLGWGLGRLSGGQVTMEKDYEPARRALLAARTSVFSLDVTDADYHSLEVGLQQVAEDTGGLYARTHLFPDQALARVEQALAGFYVLSFERPAGRPGSGSLEVSLHGPKGTVLAPSEIG
jgi:VWFA-related protein